MFDKCLKIKNISNVYLLNYPRHQLLKNQLLDVLESYDDVQNRTTNVKATMTEWNFDRNLHYGELFYLKGYILSFLHEVHPEFKYPFKFCDFWGNVYRKDDYAIEHDHLPFVFSFVYFLKASENDSPLIFSSTKTFLSFETKVKSKEGRVIIFPSYLKHKVPKHTSKETRITLSGNITF